MKEAEASGRTVEEAVERALTELGAAAEDVDVAVIDPGSRGMLGLGAREAKVRVTLKASPAAAAHSMTEKLLRAMGFEATVRAREQDDSVTVEIRGQDLGALIGRRGATLESFELLLGVMVGKATGSRPRISVDVEGYWERRKEQLERLAQRAAERALRERRPIVLAPMPARERRVIHTALAQHRDVRTFSSGEGTERRVTVVARDVQAPVDALGE